MSYSRVELRKESGKKCESERPQKVYEKESLKGSRTERLSERTRKKEEKERHRAVSKEKNLYKVLEVEVCQKRSQRVIPYLCLRGITSSSLKRTPVLAAGFQLEGNLCHFTKSCTSSRSIGSPITLPWGDQESETCQSSPSRHKHSSC